MPVFYSPEGNPEVWEQKPDGYFTPEEWDVAHPDPAPSPPDGSGTIPAASRRA